MPDAVISFRADQALSGALTAAASRAGTTVSEAARSALQRAYVVDRPAYGPGSQHSFCADVWLAVERFDQGATTRLRSGQAIADAAAEFAGHTGNLSQLVVPRYAPVTLVEDSDRPLRGLATVLPLADSTPIGVPGLVTATGVVSDHTELVNPTAGTLAVSGEVVSPRGRSGAFTLTREVADSANPSLDALALSVMSEGYVAATEGDVAAELAALDPAGSTSAANLARDLRRRIARMPGTRRRRAAAAVISADGTLVDAAADGLDEGSGDDTAMWRALGASVDVSPDLGGVAAVVAARDSVWCWESPTRTFRYDERSGPGRIELSLYGYFACRVLRPSGVATLDLT